MKKNTVKENNKIKVNINGVNIKPLFLKDLGRMRKDMLCMRNDILCSREEKKVLKKKYRNRVEK